MPRSSVLTSAANPLLKDVRRAIVRGEPTTNGELVAETFHLLEEALRSDASISSVLAAEPVVSAVERHIQGLRNPPRIIVIEQALFHRLSGTETSQGVIALVKTPTWKLEHLFRGLSLVMVLDGLQDPGNAGSILRSSEAFGGTGLIFTRGTVSPFNTKTIRASAGSIFRMPFVSDLDPAIAVAALKQNRLDLYSTVPSAPGHKTIAQADLKRKLAFIIGSEARGVSDPLRSAAFDLSIPTQGVESLNAAVAASILLYEAQRQRAVGPDGRK